MSSFLLASCRQRRRPLTAGHFKLSRYHRWIQSDDAQSIRALHMDALYMWLTNDKHSLPPEWYMAMSVGVGATIAAGFTSPSLIQLDNGTSGLEAWNRSERDTAVAANRIAPCSIIWASDTVGSKAAEYSQRIVGQERIGTCTKWKTKLTITVHLSKCAPKMGSNHRHQYGELALIFE